MTRSARHGRLILGLLLALVASSAAAQDVPLRLWTNPDFPTGLNFGATNGISFGDYDADGYIDVFAHSSGNLWRNVGGTTWVVYNLNRIFPAGEGVFDRYGSSFGDFNNDGFPDIATEPRAGTFIWILENQGGTVPPTFRRIVAADGRMPIVGGVSTETNCWADVDGDTDLDLLVPAYPFPGADDRNQFFENLGPRMSDGLYTFRERAEEAGLDNRPYRGSARSEGAQFVDTDFDGDLDGWTSALFYQNRSTTGVPQFVELTEAASGILYSDELDEGGAFDDYDMDGDYDFFAVFTSGAVCTQIFENRGDGSYFQFDRADIEDACDGLNLGLSTADWDMDGDVDFTTRYVFRRNQFVETGRREFTVATHVIPDSHITSATPSWGDWDHDGDIDSALGNWTSTGHMYDSILYDGLSEAEKRHFRVRTMRDSDTVPQGLETEYGSNVEVVVKSPVEQYRRRDFTASGHGYLNQNEYTLTFALPPDPTPADPMSDVVFDVVADFPNLPSVGYWRVDRFVNPMLADLDLADLTNREITIFRSGIVVINGTTHPPDPNEATLLTTAAGGLVLATNDDPLVRPEPAMGGTEWVGIDFNTVGADKRVRVREVMVDGLAGVTATCGGQEGNVFLWDVTDPDATVLRGVFNVPHNERNDRVYQYTGALLERERSYRMIARVETVRGTSVETPIAEGDATIDGGVRAPETSIDPCDGRSVAAPATNPALIYASFRYGALETDPCDACSATERCDFDRCVPVAVPDAGIDGGTTANDGSVTADAAGRDAGPGTGHDDDGGCGCTTQDSPITLGMFALALIGWLTRRRTIARR